MRPDMTLRGWSPVHVCIIRECRYPVCAMHHICTRGAHGACDERWNLLPICHVHHSEIHTIGRDTFAGRHPEVERRIDAALERIAEWEHGKSSYSVG